MRYLRIFTVIVAFVSLMGILFSALPKLFSALYLIAGAAFSLLSIQIEKKDEHLSISSTISAIENRRSRKRSEETSSKS